MTKRRGILAGLFGAVFARGQNGGTVHLDHEIDFDAVDHSKPIKLTYDAIPDRRQKPANDECPTCGTIAKPLLKLCVGMDENVPMACTDGLTRCSFCNAAFFQDAVKP